MARRWNPRLHPRNPRNGQFIGKGASSIYVGRGGRYYGVKGKQEFRVGPGGRGGDVLVGGIVGYAPPGTRPTRTGPQRNSVQVRRRKGTPSFQANRSPEGHIKAVVQIPTRAQQRSYLERLNTYMLRKVKGSLPGQLQNMAERILAQRQAQQRQR